MPLRPPRVHGSSALPPPISDLNNMSNMIRVSGWLFASLLLASAPTLLGADAASTSADPRLIRITTAHSELVLFMGDDGRLYQLTYGSAGLPVSVPKRAPSREAEFHPQYGDGFICEPALQATHADGNTSSALVYVRHQTTALDSGVSLTRIELKDRFYPLLDRKSTRLNSSH